jgi:hypothetical protein
MTLATLETAVDDLTVQTTTLLGTCTSLKDDTAALIATAVTVSENATQIPLAQVATTIINTQAALIEYINGT